ADERRHGPRPVVGDRQIGLVVTSEVTHGHERRTAVGQETPSRLEGAVAVAEPYRHIIGTGLGDRQIELAVTVEVAHGDRARTGAHRQGERRLKRAIAVAWQY